MYEFIFWVMTGVLAFTIIYPWYPTWPAARWLVHTPLLLLPLWALYEAMLPKHMNIRLDIPLIGLGVLVAGFLYVGKLTLFAYYNLSRRPEMRDKTTSNR